MKDKLLFPFRLVTVLYKLYKALMNWGNGEGKSDNKSK